MSIHYLRNSEINITSWDNCVTGSFNGSLHACSWYLDLICNQWDALVEDQYKSVMPLIIKRHWGQEIIDVPAFSHELGIFSKEPINTAKTRKFIDSIPPQFRYYRILLNKYNPLEPDVSPIIYRRKYELDLIKPYHRLIEDFTPDLRSKLHQAMAFRYNMTKGLTPNDVVQFITERNIPISKSISGNNFRLLRTIIAGLIRYKSGELFGIYDSHNQLASVALFSWFITRLYMQFQFTAPDEEQNYPHLFLIDRFIEKYAETNSTLSFEYPAEGTNLSKYTGFAARESHLVEITRNKMPFYLRMFPLR